MARFCTPGNSHGKGGPIQGNDHPPCWIQIVTRMIPQQTGLARRHHRRTLILKLSDKRNFFSWVFLQLL